MIVLYILTGYIAAIILLSYIPAGLTLRPMVAGRTERPWIVWVPGPHLLLLGELADRYCARKSASEAVFRRRIKLALSILGIALAAAAGLFVVYIGLSSLFVAGTGLWLTGEVIPPDVAVPRAAILLSDARAALVTVSPLLVAGGALLITYVFRAFYKLCLWLDPKHATLYTVLAPFGLPLPVLLVLLSRRVPGQVGGKRI